MNENDKQAEPVGSCGHESCDCRGYCQKLQANPAEPVAWMDEFGNVFPLSAQRGPKYLNESMKPLYTHPAQPVQPAGAQGEALCYLKPDDVVGFVPCAEDDEDGFPVYTAPPAVAVNEQAVWDSALELSALTIQLFNEATLTRDDYMLDASECAGIILALKSMRSVATEAEKAKGDV